MTTRTGVLISVACVLTLSAFFIARIDRTKRQAENAARAVSNVEEVRAALTRYASKHGSYPEQFTELHDVYLDQIVAGGSDREYAERKWEQFPSGRYYRYDYRPVYDSEKPNGKIANYEFIADPVQVSENGYRYPSFYVSSSGKIHWTREHRAGPNDPELN